MFKISYFLVCLLGCLVLQTNANAVYSVKPCKAVDKACLISSTQDAIPHITLGDPKLGIPSSDPFMIDEIISKQPNLNIAFRENVIRGASKTKVLDVERDVDKQSIKLTISLPLHLTGKYDLQGKIQFIPATGNGFYDLQTDNVVLIIVIKYKIIEKNDNKYWKATSFNYTYDLVEKVHIKFDNLFGGDESKAKPINDMLNENWKEIIEELGNPIIDSIINSFCNIVKKWLLATPASKLELL